MTRGLVAGGLQVITPKEEALGGKPTRVHRFGIGNSMRGEETQTEPMGFRSLTRWAGTEGDGLIAKRRGR